MGSAVIEVSDGSHGRSEASTFDDVAAAWRDVGVPGHLVVLVAVTACAVTSIAWLPITARALGTGAAVVVLLVAALVDAVDHRLPNPIVALAAVPVAITVVASWSPDVAREALAGAVMVAAPLLVTHFVAPAGMGFGDVKAGLVLGAALGLIDDQVALFAMVLGLAGGAIWGLARRARSIPLGPFLVGGAIAALAVARLLGVGPLDAVAVTG